VIDPVRQSYLAEHFSGSLIILKTRGDGIWGIEPIGRAQNPCCFLAPQELMTDPIQDTVSRRARKKSGSIEEAARIFVIASTHDE
jgi:hypothetical protein